MKNVVRVWIEHPYSNGRFNGTAFFIKKNILVTAKHVVVDRNNNLYENIFITDAPDAGITPIDEVLLYDRDIAVLKVKKEFDISDVSFTYSINQGDVVNIFGFSDKDSSRKSLTNQISGYQSNEHSYELQNYLANGLSGSPIFLNGEICGIAKAINRQKNITYIIPISELKIELNSPSKIRNFSLSLEQITSIFTIIGVLVAVIALFIGLSEDKVITINENQILEFYKDRTSVRALIDSEGRLKLAEQTIEELNSFIAKEFNLKVIRESTKIFKEEGVQSTLEYFRGSEFRKYEKNIDTNIEELAGGYSFMARVMILDNNYTGAEIAYNKTLNIYKELESKYPRKYEIKIANELNDLGNLYHRMGRVEESKDRFLTSLSLKKKLITRNPQYKKSLAMTLYNLALLYQTQEEYLKSENLFLESLDIYEKLAKENPPTYVKDVAKVEHHLADLYQDEDKFEQSNKYYKRAFKNYKLLVKMDVKYKLYIGKVLNDVGVSLMKQNKVHMSKKYYDNALGVYRELVNVDVSISETFFNLGNLYYKIKEYANAIKYYQYSYKKNSKHSDAFLNLYEVSIISNIDIDKDLKFKFIRLFRDKKEQFIHYEMLKIIQKTKKGEVNIDKWKNEYKKVDLEWNFSELNSWIDNLEDSDGKNRLMNILNFFEYHKKENN